jgi:YebC/PmpR family DNA-binding regulatory protein
MSGHSKWATIKRAKAKTDAARGKVFSKYAREITIAAKIGGGDPAGNPRLRLAIEKARSSNMPKDNIQRAIEKGAGGGDSSSIEELMYEGYGPAGAAILVEVMTDNKNRTLGEIANIFSKTGGNMGKAGCVSWQFTKFGVITSDVSGSDSEQLIMDAIEAGAEDVSEEGSTVEIKTKPELLEDVQTKLRGKGYELSSAEISLIPNALIEVSGDDARKLLKLVETLEDHDDVQNVYSNFDIPDDVMQENK